MNRKRFLIVFSLIILIIIGFAVYKLITRPYMTLIIKFKDVPPIIQNFLRGNPDAYYRGYKIGRVSKMGLTDDQQYIVFYLDITYKNLKLPKNSQIIMQSEDLYGARHFSIYYPDNPSSQLLANGDVVYGAKAYERIDKYIVRDMESGRLNQLINNLLLLSGYLKSQINDPALKKQLNDLMSQIPQIINTTVRNLEAVNVNIPNASQNINIATKEISRTSANIIDTRHSISQASRNIIIANDTISQTNEILPKVNSNISITNQQLSSTNCNLSTTNANLSDVNSKIPAIPPNLLENANNMLIKVDCLSDQMVEILSKRFLIFRLMFGNPASSLKDCIQNECPNSSNNDQTKLK